jgi:hypothetical protein
MMRRFVLVGANGVGKSSFVNAIAGLANAKSDFEPGVSVVENYICATPEGELSFSIIPDFADIDDVPLVTAFLEGVRTSLDESEIEGLLYFVPLSSTRLRLDDKRRLSQLLRVWPRLTATKLWLMLTFAASLERCDRGAAATRISTWVQQHLANDLVGCAGVIPGALTKVVMLDHRVDCWDDSCVPAWCLFAPSPRFVTAVSLDGVSCIAVPLIVNRSGAIHPTLAPLGIDERQAEERAGA